MRIYPIPFRKLDYKNRYKKYQWVDLELRRNTRDHRPESYRPVNYEKMTPGDVVGTANSWHARRQFVLRKVYSSMEHLLKDCKNNGTSLAVFRPKKVLAFTSVRDTREWDKDKVAAIENQTDLFGNAENPFKVVAKLPYKFKYRFLDERGERSDMVVLDWELGMLYWNTLKKHHGCEKSACDDVRRKYFDDFAGTKDLYFFLGTTQQFHSWATNPFTIIGTFHPPRIEQLSLNI